MRLAGYEALPNGLDLIREEQERERGISGEKEAVSAATVSGQKHHPDFSFSVSRDFSDDSVEVAIEVRHYRPPGNNKSLDHRDPAYDSGEVTFGDAYYLDGKQAHLTELEWEAAERQILTGE